MAGQELRGTASPEARENLKAISAALLRRDRLAFRLFQKDYSLLNPEEQSRVKATLSEKNQSLQ